MIAEAGETFEDLVAEVRAELARESEERAAAHAASEMPEAVASSAEAGET